MAGLICFTQGQVRADNPNALSIRAHQGCLRRELWTTWEGGSIHFSVPAATHLPVSVTSYYIDSNTTHVGEYAVEKYAFLFTYIQEMEEQPLKAVYVRYVKHGC